MSPNNEINPDVECRHDIRPSIQLPIVSGVESKLGHRTSRDCARYEVSDIDI